MRLVRVSPSGVVVMVTTAKATRAILGAIGLTLLAATAHGQTPPAAPTAEQVERYIAGHPEIFAQRKIFILDQVQISRNLSESLAAQLQPLTTVDQVVAV